MSRTFREPLSTEGITWGWESYAEYLDVIGKRELAVDIGSQIAHGTVRAYAMGERGARNEPATPEDIAAMSRLVQEAVEAGALGFSSSRTLAHRAMDGEPVPGTFAAEDELFALGRAMAAGGRAVFELAPQGAAGEDIVAPKKELEWMQRLGAEIDRAVELRADPGRRRPQPVARTTRHLGGRSRGGQPSCTRRSPRARSACCSASPATTPSPTARPIRRLKAECSREELAARLADPAVGRRSWPRTTCRIDPNVLVRRHVRACAVLAGQAVRPRRTTRLRAHRRPHRRRDRRANAVRIPWPRCTT